MNQVTMILAIAAVLGPVASWGLTTIKAGWQIEAAVAIERGKTQAAVDSNQAACNAERTRIESALNKKVLEQKERADKAEQGMAPTPTEAAELADACNCSASCRERKPELCKRK